jgi:hypothetical protein
MLVDDQEFLESRFYQEWCKPQNLGYAIVLKALQTGQRMGLLALNRIESQPRYGDREVRLLTLLSPHVCRAITISDALNLKTIRSEVLEATLNALASGVYLADSLGRIIYLAASFIRTQRQRDKLGTAMYSASRITILLPSIERRAMHLLGPLMRPLPMKLRHQTVDCRLLSRLERAPASSPPSCRSIVANAAISVVPLPRWQRSSCKTRLLCRHFPARHSQSFTL